MMKFDGVYNGKLVKDWGDDEWSHFYHQVYAPNEIAAEGENDEWAKRLYLGPDLSDEEVNEALSYGDSDWIEHFDGPICHYAERDGNSCIAKLGMTHEEYFSEYPYTSVYQRFEDKFRVAYEVAKQAEIKKPLDANILEINETDASELLANEWWFFRKSYLSNIEKVALAKKYTYLSEKYPSLKNDNYDEYILGK